MHRFWLSIIAQSLFNLSMTLYFTGINLKSSLKPSKKKSHDYNSLMTQNLPVEFENKTLTQLQKLRKDNVIKVAIFEDKAYWVHNNIFYVSNIIDGDIDNGGAKPIDAHKLSKKEMDFLLEVLDNLNSV